MGDNNNITVPERTEVPRTSMDILREAQPVENISAIVKQLDLNAPTTNSEETGPIKLSEHSSAENNSDKSKVETFFKKVDLENHSQITTENLVESLEKIEKTKEKDIIEPRHIRSEITTKSDNVSNKDSSTGGAMNKLKHMSSNVFPVGCMGCKEVVSDSSPTRKLINAAEATFDHTGHIDNTPRKRPPSGQQDVVRNPLTGAGVENYSDKQRAPSNKRRDGNPLLGTGYDKPAKKNDAKVPPGGFSHGIW